MSDLLDRALPLTEDDAVLLAAIDRVNAELTAADYTVEGWCATSYVADMHRRAKELLGEKK